MQQKLLYNNLALVTANTLSKWSAWENVIVKGAPEQTEFPVFLILKAMVAVDSKHIREPRLGLKNCL